MKGVFTIKEESGYDDRIEEAYNFPGRYLTVARNLVGDWIIYYEPSRIDATRRGGRQAYIGVARVQDVGKRPTNGPAMTMRSLPES